MTVRFGALIPIARVNGLQPEYQDIPRWDLTHRAMSNIASRLNTAPHADENRPLVKQLQRIDPQYRPGQKVIGLARRDRLLYRVKEAFLVTGADVMKAWRFLTDNEQVRLNALVPGKEGLAQVASHLKPDVYDAVATENQTVRYLKADDSVVKARPVEIDVDAQDYNPGQVTGLWPASEE